MDRENPGAGERAAVRSFASYLQALRALMADATTARREWIQEVGILLRDVRIRPHEMVAPAVAAAGTRRHAAFVELRGRLDALAPPDPARRCHEQAAEWLDAMLQACLVMATSAVENVEDVLRRTHRLIADSRVAYERCNAEYTRLVADLKVQVESFRSRSRGPRVRWPFGRAPRKGAAD